MDFIYRVLYGPSEMCKRVFHVVYNKIIETSKIASETHANIVVAHIHTYVIGNNAYAKYAISVYIFVAQEDSIRNIMGSFSERVQWYGVVVEVVSMTHGVV